MAQPTAPAQQKIVPAQTSSDTVKVMNGANGQYLVDSRGMTLYVSTRDSVGKNNCVGVCLSAWPVFYTGTVVVSPPLLKSDFSSIVTANGSQQVIYKGMPLYYFGQDISAGDMLGLGINGVWSPAKP